LGVLHTNMPTPKSLRAAPNRDISKYILTLSKEYNIGFVSVPQQKFSCIPDPISQEGVDDGVSSPIDIGFPFLFNGLAYKSFVVSPDGWVCLIDPRYGTFNLSDIFVIPPFPPPPRLLSPVSYANAAIKANFAGNIKHVLFAVWFDDLQNRYEDPSSAGLSINQIDLYEKGLSQPDAKLSPIDYGVRYYNDNQNPEGRRLIIRWSSTTVRGNVIKFEFVLYENGKIEYRYLPLSKLQFVSSTEEDATVGVFMTGNSFRDFSYELNYETYARTKYEFGGATYNPSYSDLADGNTAKYACNLKIDQHWPAIGEIGAVFTFHPPLNLRRILPRSLLKEKDSKINLPTIAKTGDSRTGNHKISFDDRKSIAYTNGVVSFPTSLPRFYGSNLLSVSENQNLFSNNFIITSSIVKSLVDSYLEDTKKDYIRPFNENKIFENDPNALSDSFFLTGSKIEDVGEGFNQSLKSKTQIRLSFRVDHKTKLFGASSSIYYFNSKTNRWQYPTSSFLNGQFDIANPYGDASADRIIEVDRCFNAFGFNLISGSANRSIGTRATDGLINSSLTRENEINALTKKYDKSVQADNRYSAIDDETFTIPIQQPFLLEKAVIEIPIEAGPGWFNDKTRCFIPLTSNSPQVPGSVATTFDVGGPGITISLFNQVFSGRRTSVRDLILSGTFTHELDDISELTYSNTPDISAGPTSQSGNIWQLSPIGFKAYSWPTAVIRSGTVGQYTGSVVVNCQSSISNGFLAKDIFYITQAYTGPHGGMSVSAAHSALTQLLNTEKWTFGSEETTVFSFGGSTGTRERAILSINNFGRNSQGFDSSNRSIFGKEFKTFTEKSYDNPFYLYKKSSTLQNLKNIISFAGGLDKVLYATSIAQKQKTVASPYLLFPGDKLILSVSKSRPVFFSGVETIPPTGGPAIPASPPYTSGSIEHDIKLTTGSIHITLYGSLISEGKEFHDTLNQPLASVAIHDVVAGGTKTW